MDHLKRSEFTMIYGNWMVESIGCYSAPIYPREAGDRDDFEILTELAARYADQPLASFTANYAENCVARITANLPRYPPGLSPSAALEMASGDNLPEKIYDVMLRGGPFGDGFGSHQDGLSLDLLKANPSGVNYGPMTAGRFPDAIDLVVRQLAAEERTQPLRIIDRIVYDHLKRIGRLPPPREA